MKYLICALRDQKVSAFGRPFFMTTKGEAIRSFDDEVNRAHENNMMFHHPEDFALFELGTFEDSDGVFETHIPMLLIQGDQVKKGQEHKMPKGVTAV